jgi:F-type H+-transporting ATPase subunit b
MPQLNPHFFLSQIFWLALTFIPLFFILWKAALPKVSRVLEARHERISGDLSQAEASKLEADRLLAEYEKALAGAHARARAAMRQASDEAAAEAAKRHGALGERLGKQIKEAEGRIAAAKDEALAHIRNVAGEAAAAATERLIGVKLSRSAVEEAVGSAAGKAR